VKGSRFQFQACLRRRALRKLEKENKKLTAEEFKKDPTKHRHPAYENSLLSTVAPEYSTGEVLLGSAYRKLLLGMRDSEVDLEGVTRLPADVAPAFGGEKLWKQLIFAKGGIESPLRGGQYGSALSRQLMPIVPPVARTACVLGKKPRSRWYPANLLMETIGAGAGEANGKGIVDLLGNALKVDDTDDLFARFVSQALDSTFSPPAIPPYIGIVLGEEELHAYRGHAPADGKFSPAEQFCRDLPSILRLKPQMTRRQWTVLVEASLRLGLGMHALWVCQLNVLAWELALATVAGNPVPSEIEIEKLLWESHCDSHPLLEIGQNSEPMLKQLIGRYAYARMGLNLLLCRLQDAGVGWDGNVAIGFSKQSGSAAAASVLAFMEHVAANRGTIDATPSEWLRKQCAELMDVTPTLRELAKCDAGFTKNLFEFGRHSLGQIKAKDIEQKSYDQNYLIAYPGGKSLPVQPGPAMLILLVHACCNAQDGIPASLDDLRRHLTHYGLRTPSGELAQGRVGADLEKLGLVVDSPDAAGGRMLVAPF
jgi:hypothetical protein